MRRGKRYRSLYEQVDRTREYSPHEAITTVKSLQSAKFPEAVEAHIRLGVNVRHADQQVRGTMVLPHGLGKDVKVVAFAQGNFVLARQFYQSALAIQEKVAPDSLDVAMRRAHRNGPGRSSARSGSRAARDTRSVR